jgi:hypothetical protein
VKFFIPCYATAIWLPQVSGPAAWVLLGVFMGLICLLLRELV